MISKAISLLPQVFQKLKVLFKKYTEIFYLLLFKNADSLLYVRIDLINWKLYEP